MSHKEQLNSDRQIPATRDYQVGYGKPPKHTQWKSGQSGNPKGARKRNYTSDLAEAAEEALGEIVTIVVRGKSRRMSLAQAIMYKAAVDSGGGDGRSRRDLIQVQQRRKENQKVQGDENTCGWTIIDARPVLEEGDRQAEVTEMNKRYLEEVRRLQGIPDSKGN